MKKNIVIGTKAYPFHPGEQFLEDEIEYWAGLGSSYKVTILPAVAKESPRPVPNDVAVDLSAARTNKWLKLARILFSLDLKPIPSEIRVIFKDRKKIAMRCAALGLSIVRVAWYRSVLKRLVRNDKHISVFYSYWNTEMSYAATSLKRFGVEKVVSRAHGYDLYEERREAAYLPLKRFYSPKMDKIFVLAESAREYFECRYKVNKQYISVMPLGVPLKPLKPRVPETQVLSIVSVAYCVPVKRIDKIVLSLKFLAKSWPSQRIRWTHIGSGPLLGSLSLMAQKELRSFLNLEYVFLGEKDNKFVKNFFYENDVTCFLNVSDSEGMPVSIMEAMAAGVPVVAPNIGGISELLDPDTGIILKKNPSPDLIGSVLRDNYEFFNDPEVRAAARNKIAIGFNSQRNYRNFVQQALSMIEVDHGN